MNFVDKLIKKKMQIGRCVTETNETEVVQDIETIAEEMPEKE